ncbi:septum formation inhibitor Maf [Aurantibacter crassamenti]|uniref:septum formation inhibitor Maf n=1 Tax=Aurantibacter crassamenti TaxID=1837375 RepID=UPI001939F540|nr:septum formation inhibitor Maf [Aurantibacter crassamenti]MBM1106863.1 septum formation inhibitor Maf [Aurantibacter crassamenti]
MFKKWITLELSLVFLAAIVSTFESCNANKKEDTKDLAHSEVVSKTTLPKKELSDAFKDYWYAGEAEITSYKLEQARYGEMREGTAVLIYVTEPFLAEKQTKADGNNPDNIPVLKLNATKNYLTGIYPYSIMSSSFYPVYDNSHAIKLSFSSQEWCGQVYSQLNNRDKFEIMSHSYFENEADQSINLEKNILENELWNKLRINPKELPVGEFKVIPSFEHIRLSHSELKAYNANLALTDNGLVSTYEINYPELKREVKINFDSRFPYAIIGWSETFESGFGNSKKVMTSTATKIKTIKSPYWQKNRNEFLPLRDSLGL